MYLDVDEQMPAIDMLLEFLQSQAPESLALLEAKARLAYQEEDYEKATALYLQAWKISVTRSPRAATAQAISPR